MSINIEGLPREVKYLLLDFDGTIIDLRPKWWNPIEEAFLETAGFVPEEKLKGQINKMMRDLPSKPSKFYLVKVIWGIGRSGGLSRLQSLRFLIKVRKKYAKSKYTNKLIPGVDEFLQVMQSHNIPTAIVTTADESELQEARKSLDILKDYPVISRDDVERLKPHPEPVLKAINLLDADKEHTVFIGDFRTDIEAGQKAGVMTVGLTGFVPEISEPGLKKANPDLIVQYLPDLLKLVQTAQ